MRVLIVCSGNFDQVSPFISEQVDSLKNYGINFSYYLIKGKGIIGYLKNIKTTIFLAENSFKIIYFDI